MHHRKIGLWLYPGGHVDPNETPAEAAVREVVEETGVQTVVLEGRCPSAHRLRVRVSGSRSGPSGAAGGGRRRSLGAGR
ncbi:NUDIX domain-containing protein [Solwaraspora sp. WMMB335]|uniref:NUDIX domain-containing protein n=1 Tax=Solwaraspora sp. WMMB335 TaxID=3404118 RepID=UPI003B93D686